MTWQQPIEGPLGFVLTEMSHPCPRGCSGWWRAPAAEGRQVVDGWVTEANSLGAATPEDEREAGDLTR
ncbi:hypothetical protein F0L68_22395 [Solihabitans fulvus]|uniref:Uncharacterized protein n=1 Tax=Solihabitans fulvus TaxID=1892852 RepID=A0A5B2X5U5_9PSEU|nr:hypothetical protein [Solihabitans fulvus]KAA2258603.1 hypothetical protein F0L68_22395 [Solihabitans fulvus]